MLAETCWLSRDFGEAEVWLDQIVRKDSRKLKEGLADSYWELGRQVVEKGDAEFLLHSDSSLLLRKVLKEVVAFYGQEHSGVHSWYKDVRLLFGKYGHEDAIGDLDSLWNPDLPGEDNSRS
jgi:hypothetical protein